MILANLKNNFEWWGISLCKGLFVLALSCIAALHQLRRDRSVTGFQNLKKVKFILTQTAMDCIKLWEKVKVCSYYIAIAWRCCTQHPNDITALSDVAWNKLILTLNAVLLLYRHRNAIAVY